MDLEDRPRRPTLCATVQLASEDLDPFSVDELRARLHRLEAEIIRTKAKMETAERFRHVASGLFKS